MNALLFFWRIHSLLGAQSLHALLAPPEGDIVLEREEVEAEMKGRDEDRHEEKERVRVHEDAFHLHESGGITVGKKMKVR